LAKELAQSVGGKKIAFLLAILAAFAVLATLGNRWDSTPAKAFGAFSFAESDANGILGPGDTNTYTVGAQTDIGDNPLILQIALPALNDNIGNSVWQPIVAGDVNCGAGVLPGFPQVTAVTATC
jgi:hypothetical protein